ncbi:MAG: methionyl-tRNA formyltransferase [Odoribacteraceae bacterium]|jgi:methionyl-tRNA formyltransferase|nr:methionyl-tRNA formyltransferase [Odoribacteraceae bacterium]
MQEMDYPTIVYLGTPDFAVPPLRCLLDAGIRVAGVVTNPDKPAGRGQQPRESPVKQFARERGLPLLQPEDFRDEVFLEQVKSWHADLQVVVAFKILPRVLWAMPPLGTVNLHASLLPDYRGAAPVNRVIMNGETRTGVTTFLLQQQIDTGNIIFQEQVEIGERVTAGELHDLLAARGSELLLKTVRAIAGGQYPLVDQETLLRGRAPRSAPKIFKEEMKIDWHRDGRSIYNHIRGLSPFPAAWTEPRHRQTGQRVTLKIFSAEWEPGKQCLPAGTLAAAAGSLDIYLHDGIMHVTGLQLPGKKRMHASEFLRGFPADQYTLQD